MTAGGRSRFSFRLSDDAEAVRVVREGLAITGGYCPCKVPHTEDNRCICRNTRDTGECECGLYVSPERTPAHFDSRNAGEAGAEGLGFVLDGEPEA